MKEKKKIFWIKKSRIYFIFFYILLVLSYLPNTKQFENPNIMKLFTKLNTQIEPSKHQSWTNTEKDLNLPKPYQSFHLSNKSTSLVRTGYYYPYLWWLAFEWGQKKHKNKQWISVYLIKEILNSVGIIFWWLYSRVLYWFLYQNLQRSL